MSHHHSYNNNQKSENSATPSSRWAVVQHDNGTYTPPGQSLSSGHAKSTTPGGRHHYHRRPAPQIIQTRGNLDGCTQLLSDIMSSGFEGTQDTAGDTSHQEAADEEAGNINNNSTSSSCKPDLSTLSAKSLASNSTVCKEAATDRPQLNQSQRQTPSRRQSSQHRKRDQQHRPEPFAQSLRPQQSAGYPSATVATQSEHQADPLTASLPIMPVAAKLAVAERPVRDTDRDHHHHQHNHRRLCRHGNPVSKPSHDPPPPPLITASDAPAAQDAPAELRALHTRLAAAEAALERSRTDSEARLAELCARETELIRLRHEALRREARLRSDADREAEARAAAEARATAAEAEAHRLAASLAAREEELRSCQEKMRRINRSLSYVARASSESYTRRQDNQHHSQAAQRVQQSGSCSLAYRAAAEAAVAAAAAIADSCADSSDLGGASVADAAADTDDASVCDTSLATNCSCAASTVAPPPAPPPAPAPVPAPAVLQVASHRREFVQPSPPTLDIGGANTTAVCPSAFSATIRTASASSSNSAMRGCENADGGTDDRDFRLGLARIEDQIRRLQASLKSPATPGAN